MTTKTEFETPEAKSCSSVVPVAKAKAKRSTMTPTKRTLAALREEGYTYAITDHWNPWAGIRQDAFGFVDIIAVRRGEPIRFIQTTAGSGHAARVAKILSLPAAKLIHDSGILIEVWSWAKQGARGERKLWKCRVEVVKWEA
jgi:hypothetical protein